jgi:hypothetical protein
LQLWACTVASNASGARRHQGTDLGVFAVAVCVLMVTGAFGMAENLPVARYLYRYRYSGTAYRYSYCIPVLVWYPRKCEFYVSTSFADAT